MLLQASWHSHSSIYCKNTYCDPTLLLKHHTPRRSAHIRQCAEDRTARHTTPYQTNTSLRPIPSADRTSHTTARLPHVAPPPQTHIHPPPPGSKLAGACCSCCSFCSRQSRHHHPLTHGSKLTLACALLAAASWAAPSRPSTC